MTRNGSLAVCISVTWYMINALLKRLTSVSYTHLDVYKRQAEAFRSGNLGIMDYYRMKNIEADTSMRENIAKPVTGNTGNQPLSK